MRRLTMATNDRAVRFALADAGSRFVGWYRLYVRDEEAVLAANRAGWSAP